ncbi:VCBS domain-containing protein [Halomonas sp. N3-2A]|uniref:VCBS domain-containing protein n=1 Tax=Halomonas sp. N3-2A TaxID=2014541 RepID=UPI000B5B4615|nr:VCBS domain-containing protein [Halomonas sp. N3-2A]ASK21732.1 hypothetical protein CEK60_21630 [Halomonas sp. N3-2A]
MDSLTVTATDGDGQSNSDDLNIKIVDDAPTATDDTNAVTEGDDTTSTVETSGNVIGGSDASSGDVEDSQGADGATVTAVTSTNVPAAEATETDGTLVIDGEYGTLTINADGSYTYTLDNANLTVQGPLWGATRRAGAVFAQSRVAIRLCGGPHRAHRALSCAKTASGATIKISVNRP